MREQCAHHRTAVSCEFAVVNDESLEGRAAVGNSYGATCRRRIDTCEVCVIIQKLDITNAELSFQFLEAERGGARAQIATNAIRRKAVKKKAKRSMSVFQASVT